MGQHCFPGRASDDAGGEWGIPAMCPIARETCYLRTDSVMGEGKERD